MTQENVIKIGNETYAESEVFVSASTVAKKLEAVKLAEMARYLREQIPIELSGILNAMKRMYPLKGSATTMRRENRKTIDIGHPVGFTVGNVDLYTGDIVTFTEGTHKGEEGVVAKLFKCIDGNPYFPVFDKFAIITNDAQIPLVIEDLTGITITRHFNTLRQSEIVLNSNEGKGFQVRWEKEIRKA